MISKTFCPFCTNAKSSLKSAGIDFKAFEIESNPDMSAIQDELKNITGARSVPRVFIDQKFLVEETTPSLELDLERFRSFWNKESLP